MRVEYKPNMKGFTIVAETDEERVNLSDFYDKINTGTNAYEVVCGEDSSSSGMENIIFSEIDPNYFMLDSARNSNQRPEGFKG